MVDKATTAIATFTLGTNGNGDTVLKLDEATKKSGILILTPLQAIDVANALRVGAKKGSEILKKKNSEARDGN